MNLEMLIEISKATGFLFQTEWEDKILQSPVFKNMFELEEITEDAEFEIIEPKQLPVSA